MFKKDIYSNIIIIIDFGSQYTQLIARRIRNIGVYCEIYPYDIIDIGILHNVKPNGIILSGSPNSITVKNSPLIPEVLFGMNIPILGICYGMQAMAVQLGGVVVCAQHREFGYAKVYANSNSQLFTNIINNKNNQILEYLTLEVWMSHGDTVTVLPPGFSCIASTDSCPIVGIANESKRWYGLQFHPEVSHTSKGNEIISNFVINICSCKKLWTANNIINNSITKIRSQLGKEEVLLGLSGGIDSAVVAVLLHNAIKSNLICIFINTGLIRLQESEQVINILKKKFNINIITVNAENEFLDALSNIICPENKRKVIGNLFIKLFEKEAIKRPKTVKWLAQGTIYPDVIESAGISNNSTFNVIKSHHNVGGLPTMMKMKLIEPLKELFKDEVRELAIELGIPEELIKQHPFPGPGLGIRIIGEVRKEYIYLLRQADSIFIEELKKHHLYNTVSQAFAVFLPIKSVGIVGDQRQYEFVIALRAIETTDFMTARWAYLPHDFLDLVSRRITNEVHGISRVVYDISGKPPATIEWE